MKLNSRSFFILVVTSVFLLPDRPLSADSVMPVFSGKWFLDRQSTDDIYSYENTCGSFTYEYSNSDSSPENLAKMAFSNQKNSSCTWSDIQRSNVNVSDKPTSFPGTDDQWNQIAQGAAGSVLPEEYLGYCKDSGGNVQDTATVEVYPAYECPKNSRTSYDSPLIQPSGCITSPPVCDADVVGRDLASSVLWYVGHVGLSMIGNSDTSDQIQSDVLEVLNDHKNVINEDTFESFVNNPSAKFWGEVYSPMAQEKITEVEALSVLDAGVSQENYSPQYTILPIMIPGGEYQGYVFDWRTLKFVPQTVEQEALFRCDTFVEYSYIQGAGILLMPPSVTQIPLDIYKSFSQTRTAFPIPVSSDFKGFDARNREKNYLNSECTTPTCYQAQIQNILAAEAPNADEFHQAVKAYSQLVNDPEIFNAYLYDQAETYKDDSLRHDLFIQELDANNPIGLLSQLVQDYQNQSTKDYSLLYSMTEGVSLTSTNQINQLKPTDIQGIRDVQNLFINILNRSNDINEVSIVIGLANNVLPQDQADSLVIAAIQRLNLDSTSLKIANFLVNQALFQEPSDYENNDHYLTDRFKNLSRTIPQKTINKILFSKINTMHFKLQTSLSKPLIGYLNNQEPTCLFENTEPLSKTCKASFILWSQAYSNASQFTETQKYSFIISKLMQMPNNIAASIFLSYNPEKFQNTNPSLILKFKSKLESLQTTGSSSNKSIQLAAINLNNLIIRHEND